jgi:hypothetical protein
MLLDIPIPYRLGFQDTGSINAYYLELLHDTIIFYLIIIFSGVIYIGLRFITYRRYLIDRQSIHGKILELC